jgi:hypothetical protein
VVAADQNYTIEMAIKCFDGGEKIKYNAMAVTD